MIIDRYRQTLGRNLTPANTTNLANKIASFVDRNSEILLNMNLTQRYSFGDADRQVMFDACGIAMAELQTEIDNSKAIYSGNKVQSNVFYVCCMLAASHYANAKNTKMTEMVLTYMSLMMYVSLHRGLFKYNANAQIMDYTLANLDNTYIVRQFPSLFAFIQDNTKTLVNTYMSRIQKCQDADISYVVDACWTRLKGKFKKIAQRYYENHKSGNYLNQDSDSIEEGDYHEMDNQSFAIDRLTNKVYISLINRQYDKRFIRYSITSSDTSLQKVTNLIEDIIDGDGADHRMREVISSMITFFLRQSGKPMPYIGKGDFISYMKIAYGSNTTVPEMEKIKRHIEHWLDDNMYKYGRSNYGKTAKIQYRRCLYMFFVFMINSEARTS